MRPDGEALWHVRDWRLVEIGTVRSPAFGSPDGQMDIELAEAARAHMGRREASVRVPVRYVYGVRRGELILDRSMDVLARSLPALPT